MFTACTIAVASDAVDGCKQNSYRVVWSFPPISYIRSWTDGFWFTLFSSAGIKLKQLIFHGKLMTQLRNLTKRREKVCQLSSECTPESKKLLSTSVVYGSILLEYMVQSMQTERKLFCFGVKPYKNSTMIKGRLFVCIPLFIPSWQFTSVMTSQ